MIVYLFKMTLCSMLLLAVYSVFLEKEKMHRFNRFYLLFSLLFSFVVPLISITTTSTALSISDNIAVLNESMDTTSLAQTYIPAKQETLLPIVLVAFYIIVSCCLLYRFIKNIVAILSIIRHNTTVGYLGTKLVLTRALTVSHSFFNYVFVDKEAFEKRTIEEEILTHELTHVRQKHSIDVIVVEVLLIFAWFNPFLYLYRKAIKVNHEFLADESVLNTYGNVHSYQLLLLDKAGQAGKLSLTSHFNYLTTKKRLIMMTKTTSKRVAAIKKFTLLPLFMVSVFLFATKMVAQEATKAKPPRQQIESTVEGVSQDLMNEYQSIVAKYIPRDFNGRKHDRSVSVSDEDRNRLEAIFKQMSKEQQRKQIIVFMPPPPPLPRVVPTKNQLENWQDGNIYGVWINGKRVKNSVLAGYSNTDFANAFVSKLYKNAMKPGQRYHFQVDLMTKENYQEYIAHAIGNKKNYMGFRYETNDGGKSVIKTPLGIIQ